MQPGVDYLREKWCRLTIHIIGEKYKNKMVSTKTTKSLEMFAPLVVVQEKKRIQLE